VKEFKLEFTDDWDEGTPSGDTPSLIIEESGELLYLKSNLELQHNFGSVGLVNCPIAYDPVKRMAFRYICPSGFRKNDFSQLRAFSLDRGESFSLLELPLNQWIFWLLEWVASADHKSGQLFGLHAADRSINDRIVIDHRLFMYKPGESQLRLRPICRDAYKPLAFSRQRAELVFSGVEGIYILGLKGNRKLTLLPDIVASGQGASFHPSGAAQVAVGGDGLHLWDLDTNECQRLTPKGRHPVWSMDGNGIWYRESSADLYYYDFASDKAHQVIGMPKQRHPDFWYARPVCLSKDGRYLAASVTEKVLRGLSQKNTSTGAHERVYTHNHRLIVLDLKQKAYWSRQGFADQLCWAE
jgi:hypothetical protein